MPYLQSISQIHDMSNDVIKDLTKILENVASLKNEAVVSTPSPPRPKPHKLQEALREKEDHLEEVEPAVETTPPPEGALAEMEAKLKGYINHVG